MAHPHEDDWEFDDPEIPSILDAWSVQVQVTGAVMVDAGEGGNYEVACEDDIDSAITMIRQRLEFLLLKSREGHRTVTDGLNNEWLSWSPST